MNKNEIEELNEQQIIEMYNDVIDLGIYKDTISGYTYCIYCPEDGFNGCRTYPGAGIANGYKGCWTDYGADNGYNCCAITWACGAGHQGCGSVR